MNKINPYYIVKTAFTKQADTISMQFEPSSTPTWSLDNLADKDPTVQKTPWQATQQHPAIKDINQRYSSRIYDPRALANLVSLTQQGKPYITNEQAQNILTGVRNNDLLLFLLSRGYPTRQEPYLANIKTVPEEDKYSQFSDSYRHGPFGGPRFGEIATDLLMLPTSGHEAGHSADINDKLDYGPVHKYMTSYSYHDVPSMDILRAETAATLGHYAALKKALSDRPDLYDKYVALSAPSLIPALGGYYVAHGPNAVRELGSFAGGVTNTIAGMNNPANWNKKSLQHLFNQGTRISHKLLGKPVKDMGFNNVSPWQNKVNDWLYNIAVNNQSATDSTKEPWKSLVDEMRTYAKRKYGFNNSIQWYNPDLSPAENVGFGTPQNKYKVSGSNQSLYTLPHHSPLLDELNTPQE